MASVRPAAPGNAERLFRRLSLVYAVFLAAALLMPLSFTFDPHHLARQVGRLFSLGAGVSILDADALADILQNVILFLPMGFLRRLAGRRLWRAAALGAAVSLCVESLQVFIPGRVPSAYDLVTNSGGALLGAVLGGRWGPAARRVADRFLRLSPARWTLPAVAGPYLAGALFFVLVPVVRPAGAPWDPALPLYLGGLPRDRSFWRGTVHRIAFWGEARPVSNAEGDTDPPALDLDFRRGPEGPAGRWLADLPPSFVWTRGGLRCGGTPLRLLPGAAQRLVEVAGTGGSFTVSLWLSPERFDGEQEGVVVALGSDVRRYDFCVQQGARSLEFFSRTAMSGAVWNKPNAPFKNCLTPAVPQRWTFVFGPTTVTGYVDGRPCPERFSLCRWASSLGLLLASPIVTEPLSLVTALFVPFGFLVGPWLPGGRRGAILFAACALALPAAGFAGISVGLGVPVDRVAGTGVLLGAALGGFLGQTWAEAGRGAREESA
jgi:VanZ family protein